VGRRGVTDFKVVAELESLEIDDFSQTCDIYLRESSIFMEAIKPYDGIFCMVETFP
jgi:hypothetical protein